MIVVSNTSPLTNLASISLFPLLKELYGHIYIAEGVWQELNAYGKAWPGSIDVANADWITQFAPKNQQAILALRRDLDRGESETIALALELDADIVLLDERDGRSTAQRFGLNVVGILGILIEGKNNNHVAQVKPHLDALRQQAGFFIHQNLYDQVLKIVNEK